MAKLIVMPQFLSSVYELPAEYGHRILEAVTAFLSSPDHPNLKREDLGGKAIGLRAIRVDDSCRIVLSGRENG